jgi:carbonic anhydrase
MKIAVFTIALILAWRQKQPLHAKLMLMDEVEEARQRLLQGVWSFSNEIFPEKREAYERVMRDGQSPHTLFITCADSRIEPAAITQSQPGEIFVSRNIGNLVPAYGEMMGGISAVIEYAVSALEVKQVVICGHSDCGAMKGLLNPSQVAKLPTVKSWLRNAEAALSVARALQGVDEPAAVLDSLIEQNVLLQLNHLRSHPSIAGRLALGKVGISGWVYNIAQGTVNIYNETTAKFEPASAPTASASKAG